MRKKTFLLPIAGFHFILIVLGTTCLPNALNNVAYAEEHLNDNSHHNLQKEEGRSHTNNQKHQEGQEGKEYHHDDESHHKDHDGEENHDEEGNDHKDHEEEESGVIKLNSEQQKLVGIETYTIIEKAVPQILSVPGTVQYNAYKMADVSLPMEAIIVERHVELGEAVKTGQALATISSVSVGEAQADYLRFLAEHSRSSAELKRLKGLNKKNIVSSKRFQQAKSQAVSTQAGLRQAKARLETFGLDERDIQSLTKRKKRLPFGQVIVKARQAGMITFDDFRIGEAIPAGKMLMQIVDESEIWVEAKLGERDLASITSNQKAIVRSKAYPNRSFKATVLLLHHTLDPITRTAGVRLSIKNMDDSLKPGMFVNVEIITGQQGEDHLLVPEESIQRQGSEHIVFIEEEPGHYERREISTGKKAGGWVEIINGIKEGEKVVTNASFTLLSELAKSGFEAHNH